MTDPRLLELTGGIVREWAEAHHSGWKAGRRRYSRVYPGFHPRIWHFYRKYAGALSSGRKRKSGKTVSLLTRFSWFLISIWRNPYLINKRSGLRMRHCVVCFCAFVLYIVCENKNAYDIMRTEKLKVNELNTVKTQEVFMNYECKITVLETKVFPELQESIWLIRNQVRVLASRRERPSFWKAPEQDDFYNLMNGKFCGEAWDAISRYVYAALQGGSIMRKWTNDDRMMIACCNDGTRPVIFKIERIDIPENEEEKQWLEKQNFKNTADDAYTGWQLQL